MRRQYLGGFRNRRRRLWLSFPFLASLAAEAWLHRQGFQDVSIRVGYPRWTHTVIPALRLGRELNGEWFTAELRGSELEYSFPGLMSAQLDRVTLPDVSVLLTRLSHPITDSVKGEEKDLQDEAVSPLSLLSMNDLVQGIPVLLLVNYA